MANKVIIYKTQDGKTKIDVTVENETVWLTQKQMAELFQTTKQNVSLHIKNIFEEGELDETEVVKDFLITADDGKSYNTKHYNLDVIISVGYRVKSLRGTQFRIWATNTLRDFFVNGFVLNEKRLREKTEQLKKLQNSMDLLRRCIDTQAEDLTEAQELTHIMSDFANGLTLLDDFDHKELDTAGKNVKPAVCIGVDEFLSIIDKMKTKCDSDIFANPKDDSFESSVNQIYQTFGGQDLYPSLEEKAATLLYLIVKNHSFSDGNKRIGANCFLYFLQKNHLLYKNDTLIISSTALAAITLLIACSKPEEMDIVKQLVISVLNRN